jgi:hypothetical protein
LIADRKPIVSIEKTTRVVPGEDAEKGMTFAKAESSRKESHDGQFP